jgi:hypothetical protein
MAKLMEEEQNDGGESDATRDLPGDAVAQEGEGDTRES